MPDARRRVGDSGIEPGRAEPSRAEDMVLARCETPLR